jgi:hypothetical protein
VEPADAGHPGRSVRAANTVERPGRWHWVPLGLEEQPKLAPTPLLERLQAHLLREAHLRAGAAALRRREDAPPSAIRAHGVLAGADERCLPGATPLAHAARPCSRRSSPPTARPRPPSESILDGLNAASAHTRLRATRGQFAALDGGKRWPKLTDTTEVAPGGHSGCTLRGEERTRGLTARCTGAFGRHRSREVFERARFHLTHVDGQLLPVLLPDVHAASPITSGTLLVKPNDGPVPDLARAEDGRLELRIGALSPMGLQEVVTSWSSPYNRLDGRTLSFPADWIRRLRPDIDHMVAVFTDQAVEVRPADARRAQVRIPLSSHRWHFTQALGGPPDEERA